MIRHDNGARALMGRMRAKYDWTDQVAEDIDWDTHRALIRRHSKRSVQVVKLVHNIVPTNAQRKTYGQIRHSDCPLYRLHPETTHHIMRCQHGTRKKWRESTKGEMVKAGKHARTSIEMVEAFVGGWFHWLDTGQPPDCTGFPTDIQEAISTQTRLGWDQVINGRITKKWASLRPSSPSTRLATPTGNATTTTWTLDILDVLWKQWFTVWEARNKTVHGNTQTERQRKQRTETEQKIKDIYARKSDYLPSEQALLCNTAEEFIATKGLTTLQNWVRLWAPVFVQSAQRCHSLSRFAESRLYGPFSSLPHLLRCAGRASRLDRSRFKAAAFKRCVINQSVVDNSPDRSDKSSIVDTLSKQERNDYKPNH